MNKIFAGIVLGCLLWHLLHQIFLRWQLRELKRIAGLLPPEDCIYCNPGKWGKRFKYLHHFFVETWLYLLLQLGNLKKDLMKFCLKFNILNFKSTPLGKCLQSRIDTETEIFGSSLVPLRGTFPKHQRTGTTP